MHTTSKSQYLIYLLFVLHYNYDMAQSAVCSPITMKIVIIKLYSCSYNVKIKSKLGLRY